MRGTLDQARLSLSPPPPAVGSWLVPACRGSPGVARQTAAPLTSARQLQYARRRLLLTSIRFSRRVSTSRWRYAGALSTYADAAASRGGQGRKRQRSSRIRYHRPIGRSMSTPTPATSFCAVVAFTHDLTIRVLPPPS